MNTPAYCRLSMNNQDIVDKKKLKDEHLIKYTEIGFFAENGGTNIPKHPISTAFRNPSGRYDIRKEKNYTLKGPKHKTFSSGTNNKPFLCAMRSGHLSGLIRKTDV